MAPSPSKEPNSVYDIRRLVYTTWQRNRIENSKLNEIDGISSAKRAFHRLCSSNRGRVKTRVSFPHPKIDFFILTLFSRFITKSFHIPYSFHGESERVGIGSELEWRNGEWY